MLAFGWRTGDSDRSVIEESRSKIIDNGIVPTFTLTRNGKAGRNIILKETDQGFAAVFTVNGFICKGFHIVSERLFDLFTFAILDTNDVQGIAHKFLFD